MEIPQTPVSLGYSMPAEWQPHDATWLSWPKNPDTFPPSIIKSVESIYCQMVKAIALGEKAKILVDSPQMKEFASKKIEKAGADMRNVIFYAIKSEDAWIRDYGPTFVTAKGGKKAAVKWNFNAWGGKYKDLMPDNMAGKNVVDASKANFFKPNIVMEGGSIDVNGRGSLLTTRQCLLNKNRNPRLNQTQIEQYLKDYLSVKSIIWLESGIAGDDTDGHVDDFARFVGKNSVVCASEGNTSDPNTAHLRKNLEILKSSGNLEVEELPMPREIIEIGENRRLPASYANFYISNKAVLLPVFHDEKDKSAAELLQSHFPNREIVQIYTRDLVFGYGGIHCVTQQEPKAP